MVEVAAVGVKRALSVQDAAAERKERVRQRHGQREHRHDKRDDRVELEQAEHRHRCQHVAEQQGTGIAHENAGGIEVVGHEADARAGKCRDDERHVRLRHEQRHDQNGHAADGRYADGQTVKPVDEVDGVGDADDPQHGQRNGEPAEDDGLLTAEHVRVRHNVDDHAMQHGDDGGEDLDQKLRPRAQGDDVVNHAGDDDDDRPEQNAAHLLRDVREQEHRHDEAQKDGQTAHAGDGMVVHAPGLARYIHGAEFLRQDLDDRRQRKADHERDEDREHDFDPDSSVKKHENRSPIM